MDNNQFVSGKVAQPNKTQRASVSAVAIHDMPDTKGTLIDHIRSHKKALTVQQLAVLLSLSPKYIYALVKSKRLACIRIGASVRLDPKTTADWLLAHSTI